MKLILGQDAYEAIRPLEYFTVRRTKDTPLAVRHALGWVLSGPVPSTVACPSTCFTATSEQNDELAQVIKSWYDLESYGTYKTVDSKSQADARAMDILESTTFCDGVRYHVGMLWADSHSTLPNNYCASLAQLKSLEKRLKNDPSLNERYAKTITDDLDKGYIRVVSSEELASSTPREWYLPHHPVLNPNKPKKSPSGPEWRSSLSWPFS